MHRTQLTAFYANTVLLESRCWKCATGILEKFKHRELFQLHLLVILLRVTKYIHISFKYVIYKII